ncbi:MAG: aldehyde dehydrogenase family protein, partial [Bacilli bacterium]
MKENKQDVATTIDQLVVKGLKALEVFSTYNQEQVDHIVAKASVAALDNHGTLALQAVEETKRGVFEDKAIKNLFACEHVLNSMRDLKTCGVISEDRVNGIIEIAEPVGVVCGIVPTTNPTSTTIFKCLIALKTRNPIIFAFHPSANKCSIATAQIILDAAIKAGAPKDCIQWIETPSIDATNALMNHPGIATILATGGNAMVKAAYSCGKPALGVGAGNVPAMIASDANVKQAVNDICMSKAFDNGMICASEQAAIINELVYDEAIALFKKYRVHFLNDKEKALLEEYMFGCKALSKNCASASLNADVVGQSAFHIAQEAGFKVPQDTSILAGLVNAVGDQEPLTREKLSPVLAILKAKDDEEAIMYSAQMVAFNGLGHSAAIHTKDEKLALKFAQEVKAIRIIENAPSTFGGIGDVYNAFLPSLTLGCGSYGKNSVAGNVGAVNLINIKKVGRRNNNMQWFKVPPKIYFEQNSITYLQDMEDVNRVFIVCDETMVELGHVKRVLDQL